MSASLRSPESGILFARRRVFRTLAFFAALVLASPAPVLTQEGPLDPERIANTILLDSRGVENLGIETVAVSEESFEESFFAVGRIKEIPRNHAVLSSRIAGRIVDLKTFTGDLVKLNDNLVQVESRVPGDPPPKVWLQAPMDGLVVESHVRLGEPVEPEKELLDIHGLSEVWAVAQIPEDLATKLEVGKTKAYIRVAALKEKSLTGTLLRFGTFADVENGTVDAIFEIPNEELRMRPGMRVEFNVVTALHENVMAVPREAIQGDPSNRVVYVKDYDLPNAYIKAPVKLGSRNERLVEVTGLFPGDEVVTTGSYMLGFAGGGSGISLKEALDAAHGHEHNPDGSEMTPAQKAALEAESRAAAGSNQPDQGLLQLILAIAAGAAFLLLILTLYRRHPGRTTKPAAA